MTTLSDTRDRLVTRQVYRVNEDLVYLMGGERNPIDVCDYPRINRRMYRENGRKQYLEMEHLHDVPSQTR
ncbi:MAG: hypothetical protein WD356_05505 [Pseudomonadales bacterium]